MRMVAKCTTTREALHPTKQNASSRKSWMQWQTNVSAALETSVRPAGSRRRYCRSAMMLATLARGSTTSNGKHQSASGWSWTASWNS